jgi:hypothetical protein
VALKGYVDGIRQGSVVGWAHDPDRPQAKLELSVELDGEPIGSCLADLERDDLRRRGVGDGRHGFRVALPRVLDPGSAHQLLVRDVSGAVLPLAESYMGDATSDEGAPRLLLTTGQEQAAVSGGPQRVGRGAGGWLYPGAGGRALRRSLGTETIDPGWARERARRLVERQRFMTRAGRQYLPVAMPPKAAVYPEHLPLSADGLPVPELWPPGTPTATLNAVLREEPALELLDLRGVLTDARRHGRVFTRLGTGLTWTGAFHAYRAIAKELGKRIPAITPLPVSWLVLGDLVAAQDAIEPEHDPELEPQLARTPAERDDDSKLSALILLAAPVERVAVFLRGHFRRTTVAPATGARTSLLEESQADVVIEILAEDGDVLG